jgi:RNA polymerase sigma-70 factor (ECF subfamily)
MSLDKALGQLVDYKKLNDETLMRLIAQAQENALGELYDRYSRLVYSMALNSVGEPALAEEITQDVFLRIWNKATTYQAEQGKVMTWIASITRYRSIDMLRRLKVRPEGNRSAWVEEDDEPFESIDPIDIEEQVELNQRSENIRKAIAELPKDQRQALTLAFFNGYSHAEIAQILNEPLGTVKTRIRLAMQKLRQTLRY